MKNNLKKSAQKVQDVLNQYEFPLEVVEFSESTRTAQEAADAIGCTLGQIAKSLIFRGSLSNKPILIIASGANRVKESLVKHVIGEKLGKADADFVLEHTGYAIGGIPPVGHSKAIDTYIDKDLLQYEEIWAAAGTPNTVFKLTPTMLQKMTDAKVISVL